MRREELSREEAIALFAGMGEHYKVEIIEGIPEATRVALPAGRVRRPVPRPARAVARDRSPPSSSPASPAPTGGATPATRCSSASTARPGPARRTSTRYLKRIEEAKQRDHRRLGQQLDLFSLHPIAPGSPFFHPKGAVVYNTLVAVHAQPLRALRLQRGHHAAHLQDRAVEDVRALRHLPRRHVPHDGRTRTSTASSR